MKQIFGALLLIIALVALTTPATAQSVFNYNGTTSYYTTWISSSSSGKTFAASQIDTSASLKVGGAQFVSFTLQVRDSANADFYVDYATIEPKSGLAPNWTNIYADSCTTTVDTGVVKEYVIRSHTVESGAKLDGYVRTRLSFRATKEGVTTPKYYLKVNYVPAF